MFGIKPSISYAQPNDQMPGDEILNVLRNQMTLQLSPNVPEPGERVEAEISSNALDLTTAQVSWYVNGELRKQEQGSRSFTFTAGDIGEATTLEVIIVTREGRRLSESRTVSTADVDLHWEANTYTPPFYKGRARYTHQSEIEITAFAAFGGADPSQLVYTWHHRGRELPDRSGVGENSITISKEVDIAPYEIMVEVRRPGSNQIAQARLNVVSSEPELRVYETDPLAGVDYGQAVGGGIQLSGQETTLFAEPYFWSIEAPGESSMNYQWLLNDDLAKEGRDNTITLRSEGDERGRADITVFAENADHFMQEADSTFRVQFGR